LRPSERALATFHVVSESTFTSACTITVVTNYDFRHPYGKIPMLAAFIVAGRVKTTLATFHVAAFFDITFEGRRRGDKSLIDPV
jgi:hypothetical protein